MKWQLPHWIAIFMVFTQKASAQTEGIVTNFVGDANPGYTNGFGITAEVNEPRSMSMRGGNEYFYVADTENFVIRKVAVASGEVTTIAGTYTATQGYAPSCKIRQEECRNGIATYAEFAWPSGVAYSHADNTLYVADKSYWPKIRKVDFATGGPAFNGDFSCALCFSLFNFMDTVSIVAGNQSNAVRDGTGTEASFSDPQRLTLTADGRQIYVAEFSITDDRGSHDGTGSAIRRVTISSGKVETIAGGRYFDQQDGVGTWASFTQLQDIDVTRDGSILFAAEYDRIRTVETSSGVVRTIWTYDGGSALSEYGAAVGVAIASDGTTLYFANAADSVVNELNTVNGNVSVLAGEVYGNSDGTGTGAMFARPREIVLQDDGLFAYVLDVHRIRQVSTVPPEANNQEYSLHIRKPQVANAYAVATDITGNAYVTGAVYNISGSGTWNMFVHKINAAGTELWTFTSSGVEVEDGRAIVVEDATSLNPNILVTGRFSTRATFGGFELNAANNSWDMFVAKMSDEGVVLWANAGGGWNNDMAWGIAPYGGGRTDTDMLVVGEFKSELFTFGGSAVENKGGANMHKDIFVMKIAPTGSLLWVSAYGGEVDDYALAVSLDAYGDGYITGGVKSQMATFDSWELSADTRAGGLADAFVAKVSADGTLLWVLTEGGPGNDEIKGVSALNSGMGCIAAGFFTETATFGDVVVTSQGRTDGMVMRLSADGAVTWLTAVGGEGTDMARAIELDEESNAFVAGSFAGTASFAGIEIQANGAAGDADDKDAFLMKVSHAGSVEMVVPGGGAEPDYGYGVALAETDS
eukprot:gene1371-1975_t